MPDIQAQTPDGVTHSFPDGTPDEVVDRVIKNHVQNVMPYTEKGAAAAPPTAPNPIAGEIKEKGRIQKIGAPSELTGTSASPSEDAETAGETSTALGLVANPKGTIGSIVGAGVGAPALSSGARRTVGALGGSKEAQDTAGTIGGWIGGLLGGALGGVGAHSVDIPDETTIGGFKFKNPFAKPLPGVAPTQPTASDFYENRGADLMKRTGDVETEGQQTSTGYSRPIGPDASEHYANRGANLVGRTGDVDTEGQQMSNGHDNPLGPAKPTPEENLTRAEKAGKASKVPNRMPRSRAAGINTGEAGGTGADRQAGTRGASEGRPATWTNDKVYELAAKGNRDALMEIRQRQLPAPPNSRYVTGDVSADRVRSGPLSLSTSETEHMPITPGGKVRGISKVAPKSVTSFGSGVPHIDDLELAYQDQGMGGQEAHELAQRTLYEAQDPSVSPIIKQQALDRIQRLMGGGTK